MSTPLVEQKPFNAHSDLPWDVQKCENDEVSGTSISFDLHHEDEDGFSFVAEFTNSEDAEFASHACNTYYQREAELQSMRERLSRMEAALRRAQESICYAMEEGVDIGGTAYIDEALSNK